MTYALVYPDVLLDKPLTYSIPDNINIGIGDRVTIPLQKKTIKGTVISLSNEIGNFTPLNIIQTNPSEKIPPDLLSLMQWMHSYYLCPFFKLTKLFFPSPIRNEANPLQKVYIKRNIPLHIFETKYHEKKSKTAQAKIMSLFRSSNRPMRLSTLLEKSCTSKSPVDTLIKEGILISYHSKDDDDEFNDYVSCKEKTLNAEQQHAVDTIKPAFVKATFAPFLLHGVTGSGKTEVYIKLIKEALALQKQVLYLVPEVALTGQTVDRLKSHFPKQIAVFHHKVSEGKKHTIWKSARNGEISIILAARSGVFIPLPDLGLIIIDEEHDASYKQTDEMPCYHARDIAIKRASLAQSVIVLGSATPSLESYHNAQQGKYQYLTLEKRPSFASLPKIQLIDKTTEHEQQHFFSPTLLTAIRNAIAKGQQAMLFLNRRGSFSTLICTLCKEALTCKNCTAKLTYHERDGSLQCHLCGFNTPSNHAKCSACNQSNVLQYKAPGTQFIEKSLHAIFPEYRTLRMDSDTTSRKGEHERLYKKFRSGNADILIGTQMMSKGFDFPNVTVVGVLFADLSLHIPDYRSQETTFQLLSQVAGRAGRGHDPGTVYIQTSFPSHPLFSAVQQSSYTSFMKQELQERDLCLYPPFQKLIKFLITGPQENEVKQFSNAIRQLLINHLPEETTITPTTPCLTMKINNQYRYQFLLKSVSLKACIERWGIIKNSIPKNRYIKLLIDINPLNTI